MSKRLPTRKKITRTLVSFLVFAIFLTPAFLTTKWVLGIVNSQDSRKVVVVQPLQVRPINKTSKPLAPFSEPVVSVTFDDGWESVYTNGLPVMQKDGIRSTQYIITDTFDNPSYLSVAQIKSMQAAGHEVASHTVTHADLTTLDDQQLAFELGHSKQVLTHDFGPIKDFTSPYGSYNAHTLQMIGQYYRSQKNAEGDPTANSLESINTKSTFNPLNITSYTVRQSTTPEEINKLLADARNNNGWLVLTYHQIDYSSDDYAITPEVFAQQMGLIDQSNIRSATVGQVLNVLMPNYRAEK